MRTFEQYIAGHGYGEEDLVVIQPYETVGFGERQHSRNYGPPVQMTQSEARTKIVGLAYRDPVFAVRHKVYGYLVRKPSPVPAQ